MSDDVVRRYNGARPIQAPAQLLADAIREVEVLREENARLREATERLIRSISASWSVFELGLRQEIGNTNYVCIKEKIDAAAAAIREGGKDE